MKCTTLRTLAMALLLAIVVSDTSLGAQERKPIFIISSVPTFCLLPSINY
jgi:hypothetical protein